MINRLAYEIEVFLKEVEEDYKNKKITSKQYFNLKKEIKKQDIFLESKQYSLGRSKLESMKTIYSIMKDMEECWCI